MPAPASLLLALLPFALPQDPNPTQETETVVYAPRSEDTATASPAFDVSVDADEILATGERSLPRALGKAAGIWIQETNLGGGAPVINGLLGNNVLIVVDGVRLNDSTTRSGPNQSLNSIPPEIVERVDVIRGPTSVLYGSDAVGGAILVWTKRRVPSRRGARAGWGGELGAEYQSAAEGGRAYLGTSWAGEDDGFLATFGYQDWGDLRDGGGDEQPTAYDGVDLFGSWVHDFGDHRSLRLSGMVSRQFDVPRSDRLQTGFGQTQPANEIWNYALQDRRRYVAAFTDSTPGGFADQMQLRLSLRTYVEEREQLKTGATDLKLNRDETLTLGLGVDWKKVVGERHLLTYGFDLDHDEVDSDASMVDLTSGSSSMEEGAFAPDADYTAAGVFVQDEILGLGAFDVTAGLRYSFFDFGFDPQPSSGSTVSESGDFDALTASLAAARDLGEGVRLTTSLSQAFRAPNLDDLANEGSFFGGTELPNPDLDPEESVVLQMAVDVKRRQWSLSVGAYHSWIEDVIGRRLLDVGNPNTTGDELYMRDNAGRARILGLDAAFAHRLFGAASPWLAELRAGWTYGRQFDDTIDPSTGTAPFDDVPFRRIPPVFGSVGLVWDGAQPDDGLDRAGFSVHFAGEQGDLNPGDLSDPRIDPNGTDGWVRLDLDLEGPLGRAKGAGGLSARWRLGLHNLADAEYRVHASGIDAPGFNVIVGVNASL